MNTGLQKWQNVLIRLIWLGVISCCFLAVNPEVHAAYQSDPTVESELETEEKIQNQPWEPPPPTPDAFDWIQLKSGEWLKGEFKVLYKKTLEFDSDELDLLELDWKNVNQIRGYRFFTVRFEGPITVRGFLQVTEDKVFIIVGGDRKEFERSQLVAISAGEPKEINYWSAKINFGLSLSSGNTEQTQWSTIANIKRRTSATRFIIDWLGNFSETEGEQTINNQRLNTHFDVFKSRKYYFTPFFGEYFRDPFSNISSRVTVGAGMGYQIIDTSKTEWDVAGGPAYQKTRFDSVQAGQNESESTPAFVLGSNFDTELTQAVDSILRYNFQIVNKESGAYNHHFIAALETEITRWLDIDISFVWDRIRDPQPNADGAVPKQNDYYLILGLGVDF
jgi:putative salt-induced outer membrane protein YdiY